MRLYRNSTSRGPVSGRSERMLAVAAGLALVATLLFTLTGCGGGAAGPGPGTDPTVEAPRPPAGGIPDPITTDRGDVFNLSLIHI